MGCDVVCIKVQAACTPYRNSAAKPVAVSILTATWLQEPKCPGGLTAADIGSTNDARALMAPSLSRSHCEGCSPSTNIRHGISSWRA
jgi:hypothetical protein